MGNLCCRATETKSVGTSMEFSSDDYLQIVIPKKIKKSKKKINIPETINENL